MKAIRSIITVALFLVTSICFISAGVLTGVRFGALKGHNINDVMDNGGAYLMVNEATKQVLIMTVDDEFQQGIIMCIPENMITDLSKEAVRSLSTGEEVDLSSSIQSSNELVKNVTDYVIDESYNRLSDEDMISAQDVYNNDYINLASENLGVDVGDVIVARLELTDTPVKTKDAITADVIADTKVIVKGPIANATPHVLEKYIDQINDEFNKYLQKRDEVKKLYALFERINDALKMSRTATYALFGAGAAFAFVMFFLYLDDKRRGLGKVSSALIFSGIILLVVCIAIKGAQYSGNVLVKDTLQIKFPETIAFVNGLLDKIMFPTAICAGAYIVLAILINIIRKAMASKEA